MSSYRLTNTQGRSRAPRDEAGSPTTCPACQSSAIVTTGKKPDASSYWRCEGCGEVWNNSRLDAIAPYARRRA